MANIFLDVLKDIATGSGKSERGSSCMSVLSDEEAEITADHGSRKSPTETNQRCLFRN